MFAEGLPEPRSCPFRAARSPDSEGQRGGGEEPDGSVDPGL